MIRERALSGTWTPAMTGRARSPPSAASAFPCGSMVAPSHDPEGKGGYFAPNPSRSWSMPMWLSLLPIGRNGRSGGYRRFSFTEADSECREWFFQAARERSLRAECDRNGNLWAWWDPPGPENQAAIVTGSHLDS